MPYRPASNITAEFGKMFREAREASDVSQAEVARRITIRVGANPSNISRIESGRQSLTLEMAAALFEAIGWRLEIYAIPGDREER